MGLSTLPLFPIERAALAWPAPAAAGEAPLPPAQAAAPQPARPPLPPPQTLAGAALLPTAQALAVGTAPPPTLSSSSGPLIHHLHTCGQEAEGGGQGERAWLHHHGPLALHADAIIHGGF